MWADIKKNFREPLASRLVRKWLKSLQLFQKNHYPPPASRPSPLHPRPYAPSLEPVAAMVVEAEVDPVDVRPMGLECFPPRPGGFRPLGFCMAVPLGGHGRPVPVTCSLPWSLTCGQTTRGTTPYHQMTSHPWPHEAETMVTPIFQMGKSRYREVVTGVGCA